MINSPVDNVLYLNYIQLFIKIKWYFMPEESFDDLILYPNEERHIEFKENSPWDNESKIRITKTIIAMSNLRSGGWIIFGKKLNKDMYENIGLNQITYDSFISDNIKSYVYSHVQPPIELEVMKKEKEGKKYVGIKISGLGEMPHICSKQEDEILELGKVYIRSMGKPESTEVCNYIEMKEILDACLEKAVSNFITRLNRIGILDTLKITMSDNDKYDNEVKDL